MTILRWLCACPLLIAFLMTSVLSADDKHVAALLPELHLLEPATSSPIVHRESSILLRKTKDGPLVARLAFPADEIMEVASATRQHKFAVGTD